MGTVSHHGRVTAYRITRTDGEGPTALYVHGSGGTHQLWAYQYAPSGPTHPAVAIDLSGHGDSEDIETEPGPETLAEYAADVVAVARETDADVLVGNSLGGAVVFEVLLETEFEPRAVVFAGSGAKLAVHEKIRDALESDFEAAIDRLHQPSLLFADANEDLLDQSKETMRETGQRVTHRDFLTCHPFDVRERLASIEVPALALVGEEDQLTPLMYHEYLAENMPNCRVATLENAGHLAMLERPEAFNESLKEFFSEQEL